MTARDPGPREKLQDFHRELETLLEKQLAQQPDQDDVRLKLLELYFEQHRGEDFMKLARAYHRRVARPDRSRDWQRVASMGRMLVPGEPLFSSHGAEAFEFVGAAALRRKEPPRTQRFGVEPRYAALFETLAEDYARVRADARFLSQFELLLLSLPTRRPTPLMHLRRLSERWGGAQVYLKREDLAGENPHKVIAVAGQGLTAQRLERTALVTATPDGRRGLVTAMVAARLGLQAVVYVDAEQAQRFAPAMLFMNLMGADIRRVKAAHYRNRDIREAALEHWSRESAKAFLVVGLDAAPPPYPLMVQEFTAAIGRECRRQFSGTAKRLPDVAVARGTRAADALGLFPAFFGDAGTRLVCVDPEPEPEPDARSMDDPYTQVGGPLTSREQAVAQGILDRLEYRSVAREHAMFRASGRVEYAHSSRAAAREVLLETARFEGLVPSIETAHALAWARQAARELPADKKVLVMMADSPDKDAWEIGELVEPGDKSRRRPADSPARPAPRRS
jgi:tryptophan synthase beta chain